WLGVVIAGHDQAGGGGQQQHPRLGKGIGCGGSGGHGHGESGNRAPVCSCCRDDTNALFSSMPSVSVMACSPCASLSSSSPWPRKAASPRLRSVAIPCSQR